MAGQSNVVALPTAKSRARRQPRPYTSYYFRRGQRRPARISRSTSIASALRAIVGRIIGGEDIQVVEVCDEYGRLKKTVTVAYRKISIR